MKKTYFDYSNVSSNLKTLLIDNIASLSVESRLDNEFNVIVNIYTANWSELDLEQKYVSQMTLTFNEEKDLAIVTTQPCESVRLSIALNAINSNSTAVIKHLQVTHEIHLTEESIRLKYIKQSDPPFFNKILLGELKDNNSDFNQASGS